MPWLNCKKDGGVSLLLHVQPGAAKTKIVGLYGDRLKIAVSAPPVDGKANKEVEKFFAKTVGCAVGDVTVVAGHSSRQKRVDVYGCNEKDIRRILES